MRSTSSRSTSISAMSSSSRSSVPSTTAGFTVGERAYETVVIPPAVESLATSTLRLLRGVRGPGRHGVLPGGRLQDGRRPDFRRAGGARRRRILARMESRHELVCRAAHEVPTPLARARDGRVFRRGSPGGAPSTEDGSVSGSSANPWAEAYGHDREYTRRRRNVPGHGRR